jgi:hypothetical protein
MDPWKLNYLKLAEDRLGPIDDRLIVQRGESWKNVAQPFQILDRPHLQELRMQPGVLVS